MKDFVYFNSGDVVQIKQDLPNKPLMVVSNIQKARSNSSEDTKPVLIGVNCFWFTKDYLYQERLFSTKDLEQVDPKKRPQ
jgi:uncharacterized protein YodC (DUF2158 family)